MPWFRRLVFSFFLKIVMDCSRAVFGEGRVKDSIVILRSEMYGSRSFLRDANIFLQCAEY
jgi:hypothetical protein